MTGVVREQVHHHVAAVATVDDQALGIILTNHRAEGAALASMISRALAVDVDHPVWGPEALEPVVDIRELLG